MQLMLRVHQAYECRNRPPVEPFWSFWDFSFDLNGSCVSFNLFLYKHWTHTDASPVTTLIHSKTYCMAWFYSFIFQSLFWKLRLSVFSFVIWQTCKLNYWNWCALQFNASQLEGSAFVSVVLSLARYMQCVWYNNLWMNGFWAGVVCTQNGMMMVEWGKQKNNLVFMFGWMSEGERERANCFAYRIKYDSK